MKLEKEVTLDTYGLSLICFNENFTQNEIKELQKMYKRKIKLTLEVEEPVLYEVERKYLSDVISPFRDRVNYISKETDIIDDYETIHICYDKKERLLIFPMFKKNSVYKGMKLNKEYTLEELEL